LEDIESYLKNKLAELGDQTRLSVECRPEPEKDWQYLYEILTQDESIGVTVAVESVSYQGERLYLCPR
jgi:hypothetical protein